MQWLCSLLILENKENYLKTKEIWNAMEIKFKERENYGRNR
jgi:hypothetical protein